MSTPESRPVHTPDPPDPAGPSIPASATGVCGLDGCDQPLPARPLDELGRPKGGRRARYCSKAHADTASRQRRAADLAAVADPLALAREASGEVLPVARRLGEQLTALITRFEQAETGALGRVRAAESEAEQAHAEAARATEAEQHAETARREALAAARHDRQEKDLADRRAQDARAEAEQIRDDAWKQVAAHERARGQAEADLEAARATLEALRREHADLLDTSQEQRNRLTHLDVQLATATVEHREALARATELTTRLEQAEQHHRAAEADLRTRHAEQTQTLLDRHAEELRQARRETEKARADLERATTPRTPPPTNASRNATTRTSPQRSGPRRNRVAGQTRTPPTT